MKILPIEKIRLADAYTIKNEPIKDIDLMERAATACFNWIKKKIKKTDSISIFCGTGNNGGDGMALARLLSDINNNINVYFIKYSDKISDTCKTNYNRLKNIKTIKITDIRPEDNLPNIENSDLIIDAVFGSGLSKAVKGFIADIFNKINKSKAIVVSIDVPSGLFCDKTNIDLDGAVINADYTLTFQFAKFSFLFPENEKFIGNWQVLPIGLHPDFINNTKVENYFIRGNDIKSILKFRRKFSHKGNFGHALLIAGSYGKTGAAVLSTKACLRSGVGLLTTHIPKTGYNILQTAIPEAMTSIDASDKIFSELPDLLKYNAIGIGPGIGRENESQNAFKLLIQNSPVPLVIDADAINILGENKTWIAFLPENSILTPHPKEFERIAGKTNNNFERYNLQREFSIKNKVYIVLKGAHTAISCPDGNVYFNSTGNPGMATAGSGDVLTGIILSLFAQGYSSKQASLLGVFIHGLAGDIAAEKLSLESLIASDIIDNLPYAFNKIIADF